MASEDKTEGNTEKRLDELVNKYENVGYIRTFGPAKETRLGNFLEEALLSLFTPVFFAIEYATPIVLEIISPFHDDFENGINYARRDFALPDSIIRHYEKQAERYLQRFIANHPNDERIPEAHFQLGRVYMHGRQNRKSFEQFRKMVEHDRNHFEAHRSLVRCGKEMYSELIEYFKKALAATPNYELGHFCLGMIHEEKGEQEEAIKEYKKAPSCAYSHLQLGLIYNTRGLDKEAFDELVQAIDMWPEEDSHDIHHFSPVLEVIVQKHSDDLSFVEVCEHAIQSNPRNIIPYSCLASTYRRKGMFNEAIRTYQRVLEFEPDNPDMHRNIGDTYAIMGELDQAIQSYMKALKIGGYDGIALWRIGQILYDEGECEEALGVWSKISKCDLFLTECYGDIAIGETITRADLVKKAKERLKSKTI